MILALTSSDGTTIKKGLAYWMTFRLASGPNNAARAKELLGLDDDGIVMIEDLCS